MKILLLSAYDAESHKRWRTSLEAYFSEYDWTVLKLPPRHFSWRVRGNSLTWAYTEQEALNAHYDLLIVSSMVDLSALRGMVPALSRLPTVAYFHENQFEYPPSAQQFVSVEPQMLSFYTALCADAVVFNSNFNRETFFKGLTKLLKKLPDHVPTGLTDSLQEKSHIVPVPVDDSGFVSSTASKNGPLNIVWNHRWEYDKGPEELLRVIERLPAELKLQFHIIGQRFRRSPKVFEIIQTLLRERGWSGEWGFIECPVAYRACLQSSHVVLSTALHDFQGLSVLDGVAAGCLPVTPNALAYQELFPKSCRYKRDDTGIGAANLLEQVYNRFRENAKLPVPSITELRLSFLGPEYQNLFDQVRLPGACSSSLNNIEV